MASNNLTIQDATIGVAIQGGNNRFRDIIVNNQNLVAHLKKIDFKVPRCIESFHGRQDKIRELDTLFFTNKESRIVIHGLPGFGKTEISKQYAKHCERKRKVKHTFWVEAGDEETLKDSWHELSKNYEKFRNTRCLYIFDNAASRSSIFEYEPESKKHLTLITSVDGNWDGVVPVYLDSLPLKKAVKLLKTILNFENELHNESYDELANAVSCVPLGLQIVGGFVREENKCLGNKFQLNDYVIKVKESQFNVLHTEIPKSVPNSYKKTIYNAMAVSINKIKDMKDNHAELALNILFVCAFANPDGTLVYDLLQIPTIQELIEFNNSDTYDTIRSFKDVTEDSKNLFKRAIGLLINFSFVTYKNSDEYSIKFHRLTQSFLRDYLKSLNYIDKYFPAWLYTLCRSPYYISWSVLSYCEKYSDIVHTFFKTQNSKFKQINILEKLVRFGCVLCLYKIFKDLTNNLLEFTYLCFSIPAKNNQQIILEFLLQYINMNNTNADGDTVLHIVAKTGNIESIKLLIKRGSNTIAKNNAGDTPLFVLAKSVYCSEYLDWEAILTIFQFNNNLTNKNNETLLHVAAIGVQHTLVEELILKHKIDIHQKDSTNRTPIDYLFSKNNNIHVFKFNSKRLYATVKIFFNHGAKFNLETQDKECTFELLSSVIENNDLELLDCALQQGCDVHCTNRLKETLLHKAAALGNLRIIEFLINKRLDINSVDFIGNTAAFKFVNNVGRNNISDMNLVDGILYLLNCQEQSQITNKSGDSILHTAVEVAHKDLTKLLIKRYKFNVNQQNCDGDTPLHRLIIWLDSESNKKNVIHIVQILKRAGADLCIVNKKQETPLQILNRLIKKEDYDGTFLIPYLTSRRICNIL